MDHDVVWVRFNADNDLLIGDEAIVAGGSTENFARALVESRQQHKNHTWYFIYDAYDWLPKFMHKTPQTVKVALFEAHRCIVHGVAISLNRLKPVTTISYQNTTVTLYDAQRLFGDRISQDEIFEHYDVDRLDDAILILQTELATCGVSISNPYGPGALARNVMYDNDIKSYMNKHIDDDVAYAIRHATAGPRVEGLYMGHEDLSDSNNNFYTLDINGAFFSHQRDLPSLQHGHWEWNDKPEFGALKDFAVYRVQFGDLSHVLSGAPGIPMALWQRAYEFDEDEERYIETLWYAAEGEGWYWGPEAELALGAYANAKVIEGYEFVADSDCVYPFKEPLERIWQMHEQVRLPTKRALKELMHVFTGKNAQNKRKIWFDDPAYRQLEWASYVWAATRAQLYREAIAPALQSNQRVIRIYADSILVAGTAVHTETNRELGGWKLEATYDELYFLHEGAYFGVDTEENLVTRKLRGLSSIEREEADLEKVQRFFDEKWWEQGRKVTLKGKRFGLSPGATPPQDWDPLTWSIDYKKIGLASEGIRAHLHGPCDACHKNIGVENMLHSMVLPAGLSCGQAPYKTGEEQINFRGASVRST